MTMEEERKLRYRISLLLSTKPMFVEIERTEELQGDKRRIYASVRGYKYGILMNGEHIEQVWRMWA